MEDFNYNLALTYACIALLVGLLVAMICIWATIKMITTKKFGFLSILYRNILLFGVIGCIEYVFFMEVAIKYVPVLPSYAEDILREDLR